MEMDVENELHKIIERDYNLIAIEFMAQLTAKIINIPNLSPEEKENWIVLSREIFTKMVSYARYAIVNVAHGKLNNIDEGTNQRELNGWTMFFDVTDTCKANMEMLRFGAERIIGRAEKKEMLPPVLPTTVGSMRVEDLLKHEETSISFNYSERHRLAMMAVQLKRYEAMKTVDKAINHAETNTNAFYDYVFDRMWTLQTLKKESHSKAMVQVPGIWNGFLDKLVEEW